MIFLSECMKSFRLYTSYILLFLTRHGVPFNDNKIDLRTNSTLCLTHFALRSDDVTKGYAF